MRNVRERNRREASRVEPGTSVLTLLGGRERHLANLLLGLLASERLPEEVVVAVMGGDGFGPSPPEDLPFPVRTVRVPAGRDLPLARARNEAARTSSGERLVFLDVDCIPGRGLVGRYAAGLRERDALLMGEVRYLRPGVPGPSFTEKDLRAGSEPHPRRARPPESGLRRADRHEEFWSLSFAVRRGTFFGSIGGFDESFTGYGGEDTDLAFAARRAGVGLFWVGEAPAYHQHHPVHAPPVQHVEEIAHNARRFRDKWGVWPMEGWLCAFRDLGLIEWSPGGEDLCVLRPPTAAELLRTRRQD